MKRNVVFYLGLGCGILSIASIIDSFTPSGGKRCDLCGESLQLIDYRKDELCEAWWYECTACFHTTYEHRCAIEPRK